MNSEILKKWINEHLFKDEKIIGNRLTIRYFSKYPEICNIIKEYTGFLSEESKIAERLYCIQNNLSERRICKKQNCNNYLKFLSYNYGYSQYCSRSCAGSSSAVIISQKQKESWNNRSAENKKAALEKRSQTCMERYGTDNPAQNAEIKNKISNSLKGRKTSFSDPEVQKKVRKTWQKKYGVDHIFMSSEIKEKIKNTNLRLYGSENVFSNAKIKEKIKETNIQKYGVENPSQNNDVRFKIMNTCLHKYENNYSLASKEIREKGKRTLLKKYGHDHPMKIQSIKDKLKETCLSRYGVKFASQKNISKDVLERIDNYEWLYDQHVNLKKPSTLISREQGVSETLVNKRLHFFDIEVHHYHSSAAEYEIKNYILSLIPQCNILENKRNIIPPFELDLFIPEFNLAIEFNGLYWHSYNSLEEENKHKHLDKLKLCLDKQIRLLTIFENEWSTKQDIWKSIISSILMKNHKINARECKITEIKDSKEFLDENHIQGAVHSNINIGLYYQDELVSLMTFGIPRYNKNYNFEILRFCNKKHTSVAGGASRLFKYFINNYNPSSVISYADRRHGEGQVYPKLGFQFKYNSYPNYFYFSPIKNELYSRIKFQKHKLPNLLKIFDPDLSESQNMFNNGYRRIWDCGNAVYEWNRNVY